MSATPDLRFEPERERDSVGYALGVLRRRWLVVVAAVVACVVAGLVITGVDSSKRYESSARVLFGTSALSDAALQVDRFSDNPEREAATNVLLAGSEAVAAEVRKRLGLSTSSADLLDKVEVEAEQNANVLQITATDEDPREAARLANGFASEFVAFRASTPRSATSRSSWRTSRSTRRSARTCASRFSGSPRCGRWPTATRA